MEETNENKIRLRANNISLKSKKTKKREEKLLLDRVDFVANPGELVAIMGPSGAGKTTLLSALCGRIDKSSELSGEILINSIAVNIKDYRHLIGFVEQDDILYETATVRESILFSAMNRLPQKMSDAEKELRVDEVIQTLGLEKCQHSRIGDPNKRGISGGERKRTSIGIELVTRPSVLFLDEPTSGLDSTNAYQVITLLKELAQSGRTIICSIHQPRASIFKLFNRVTLLQNGRLMYYGPPNQIAKFFRRMGYEREEFDNIADYILDVASGKYVGKKTEDAKTPNEITEEYYKSKYIKYLEHTNTIMTRTTDNHKLEDEVAISIDEQLHREKIVKSSYATKSVYQARIVAGRTWNDTVRNRMRFIGEGAQHVFVAIFLGLLYLQLGFRTDAVYDLNAALFYVMLQGSFTVAFTAGSTVPKERIVINKERAVKMYRVCPYYIANTLVDIPFQFMYVCVFSSITYWMIGFTPDADRFMIFISILYILLLIWKFISLACAYMFPDIVMANLVISVLMLLFLSFGGFFLSDKNVPKWLSFIQYLSPFRYAFRAIAANQYYGVEYSCPENSSKCPFAKGEDVLTFMGMGNVVLWQEFMIMCGMLAFYFIAGYISLRYIKIGRK